MTEVSNLESYSNIQVPAQNSATLRMTINIQKINILNAINELLVERKSLENRRNSLLQSAAMRQHQVQEMKDQVGFAECCGTAWQQKLSQAQIKGTKLENECILLRERRDAIHKQLIANIEGSTPYKTKHISPSIRANYKIQATLLQRDISELKRRVLHAKMRLDSEIKAIDDLSNSVKKLRLELGTKKVNSMIIRPQTLALLKHANQCRSSRENYRINTMKNADRMATSVTVPREN